MVANIYKDRMLVAKAKEAGIAVYIGRECDEFPIALYGNRHKINKNAEDQELERNRVCDAYEHDLETDPLLREHIKKISRGSILLCYCDPLRCHGHAMCKFLNE